MKPKIYDCVTFFQSELLFNIRFNLLKDIVDYFVVCEATRTHTGKAKKLILIIKNGEAYQIK